MGTDNMAARCMLDKQGYTRVSTRPLPCTHTHPNSRRHVLTHRRAHARTHTQTQKYVILIAFPRKPCLGERDSFTFPVHGLRVSIETCNVALCA